jgi:hypothetical protein
MAKQIEPLKFYQDQFNTAWYQLHKAITEDVDDSEEDREHYKVVMEYLDSLGQLLDELVYAAKNPKKSKKTKKSKK